MPRPHRPNLLTFSQLLKSAGYRLDYVGKWHVHPKKDPTEYGFHSHTPLAQYSEWRLRQGLGKRPRVNGYLGETDAGLRPDQSQLAWQADRVIQQLRSYDGRTPFFLRWDPVEPHLPNIVPEPYASMYPPASVPPWHNYDDPLTGKPYIQAQQRRTWRVDGWTWEDWAPIVARYLGEVTLLDRQIGRILSALDELGLATDTLVIYTTDHGDMCGAHGMIDVLYDDIVRVPLIARWPGKIPPGSTCDAFVCNALDLAHTFCEIAHVEMPESFQGESLLPHFDGQEANGREDIFAMYHGNQFGLYSQRMVRNRRWKYIWNATAEDELYDLANDPGELQNLAADSDYTLELRRLRYRMVAWMEETGDRILNRWTRPQLLEGLTR